MIFGRRTAAQGGTASQVGGAVAVAVLTVGVWFAWLGWDTNYQVDAAGQQSGPYEGWQVAGCVLSLVALLAGAILAGVRAFPAAAALTVAFTVAWTVRAAATDDSGLFVVGAVLVLVGTALGSAFVAVPARLLAARLGHRPDKNH